MIALAQPDNLRTGNEASRNANEGRVGNLGRHVALGQESNVLGIGQDYVTGLGSFGD